jgi:TonB family protein
VDADRKVYDVTEVDELLQVISTPEPRYPKELRDSKLSGRVVLRYVVDATGHAEPNSFRVVSTTHEGFVEAAKEAILKAVYRPARLRGRPVRLLVEQAISFRFQAQSPVPASKGKNDKVCGTKPGEDEPVQVVTVPEPRYPAALRDSMITGRVELQYMVDTTGRVEPNSFRVLSATNEAFVQPAKEAVLMGVFKPARC